MPHQFKASPNHPAVAYLVRLHADIGGRILENKKEGLRLVESMKHVEHVIHLFDPGFNFKRIAARRRVTGNPWFKRGTLIRHALEVLREAGEALTAREVTERMLAAKGVSGTTPAAMRRLIASVQASVVNHEGKGLARVGESQPARWTIKI
jgi:hypothetical protein